MKTIFSDPIQWARGCAGTITNYRLMQFMTIILGVFVFAFIWLFNKYSRPPDHIGFLLLLFILVILIPLLYLKAIRALLIERQSASADSKVTVI
jgi:hypothetical protein